MSSRDGIAALAKVLAHIPYGDIVDHVQLRRDMAAIAKYAVELDDRIALLESRRQTSLLDARATQTVAGSDNDSITWSAGHQTDGGT